MMGLKLNKRQRKKQLNKIIYIAMKSPITRSVAYMLTLYRLLPRSLRKKQLPMGSVYYLDLSKNKEQ